MRAFWILLLVLIAPILEAGQDESQSAKKSGVVATVNGDLVRYFGGELVLSGADAGLRTRSRRADITVLHLAHDVSGVLLFASRSPGVSSSLSLANRYTASSRVFVRTAISRSPH